MLVAILTVLALWAPGPALALAKPNDPLYGRQWGLPRIGVMTAWQVTQGKGALIAILDTGVERDHPDLKANMSRNRGYDFVDRDRDPSEQHVHGTHVAGIAAGATNNKRGIAGVAPKAKILAVRVLNHAGWGTSSDIAEAIMWAADQGADVINLSLGANIPIDPFDPTRETAIPYATAKGSLVVASAGNSATPYCGTPASNPAALCIGASNERDGIAKFSNYGVRIDLAAPGTNILSTFRFGGYAAFSGTSMSAPMVSGVGALLMSMGATNIEAAAILRASAKDLGLPGYDPTYGFGRLDAGAAVTLCRLVCVAAS